MILKSIEEIEKIRESALVVSQTLGMLASEIKPGITSLFLDNLAETFILDNLCKPGFKGYNGFPNTLCISINEQVVHGIPNNNPLKDGDIVSIDCGVIKDGFYGDHAYTFKVGNVEKEVESLLEITKESLYIGIKSLIPGNNVGDIGNSIQNFISKHRYGIVKELVGHGLGRNLHEDPEIPNYGEKGKGALLREGLVVAIEPMINLGTEKVNQLDDGWTIVTLDGKPSAHFEHNIAIIEGKPEILSTFKYIYEALGIESNEEDKFKSYFD
jgi:methionine aminopeptidase, type I